MNLTDQEYKLFTDYIKYNFGIYLGEEKKSLIYSRLRSILLEKSIYNFSDYYEFLLHDASQEDLNQFIDKITTNHTFFMREEAHFDYFRNTVLPQIANKNYVKKDLYLWCAGCSSGEEPYTLQMIIQDFFKERGEIWNTQILATDISTTMLEKASKGIYSSESVSKLPTRWRTEYFEKFDESNYIVAANIRKQIVYRKLNLMDKSFPFTKLMQVIFCRNVMIYFDNETRDNLVEKFYSIIEPQGYLFVGHSESLNKSGEKYKYIMPAVYQKI